jgi:hypothetical protein
MLSIGLWQWYINITITILDIIHRSVFYLKYDISEPEFCFCLQVQPTPLDPIDTASLCLTTPAATPIGFINNHNKPWDTESPHMWGLTSTYMQCLKDNVKIIFIRFLTDALGPMKHNSTNWYLNIRISMEANILVEISRNLISYSSIWLWFLYNIMPTEHATVIHFLGSSWVRVQYALL